MAIALPREEELRPEKEVGPPESAQRGEGGGQPDGTGDEPGQEEEAEPVAVRERAGEQRPEQERLARRHQVVDLPEDGEVGDEGGEGDERGEPGEVEGLFPAGGELGKAER